jgi:hypothetical protein
MACMFDIMALPLELLLEILVHEMHVRGLERAMRLRLVRRKYSTYMRCNSVF